MDQEMTKRSSVPGYVPCVELADPEFRKSCDLEEASVSTVAVVVSHDTHGQIHYQDNNNDGHPTKDKSSGQWKPNDYIELSILACLCNFIFGLAALTLSLKSQEKWTSGRRQSAKCLGILSMSVSTLAIVSTPVIIFVCCWMLLPREM